MSGPRHLGVSPDGDPERFVALVVDRVGALLTERLPDLVPSAAPLWMSKAEAIAYTRLAPGTFTMLAASGRLPSHGGKTKVFNRDELDLALLSM